MNEKSRLAREIQRQEKKVRLWKKFMQKWYTAVAHLAL